MLSLGIGHGSNSKLSNVNMDILSFFYSTGRNNVKEDAYTHPSERRPYPLSSLSLSLA